MSNDLLFKIKADNSDAKRGIDETVDGINKLDRAAGTTGGWEAMSAKAAVATAAIASVGVVAMQGVTAMFNLTKATADAGSAIFDASIKTGLSAQSLSALKYAADTSGSSLEAVAGTVAKFNVLVGKAAADNEAARDTLEKYAITATSTDEALAQAITTITSYTDQGQKAAAAAELFKDKTGEILPVLDSFSGDLPGLIAKLREMGLVMSDEDARAADEFGDTLDTLRMQAEAVGKEFAFGLMPSVTRSMDAMSGSMKGNQGVARSWGRALGETMEGVVAYAGYLNTGVNNALNAVAKGFGVNAQAAVNWANVVFAGIITVSNGFRALAPQTAAAGMGGQLGLGVGVPKMSAPKIGGGGGGGAGGAGRGSGGGGASSAEAKRRTELEAQLDAQKLMLRRLEDEYNETMKRIRAAFKENDDQGLFSRDSLAAVKKYSEGVAEVRATILALDDELGAKDTDSQMRVRLMRQWDEAKKITADIRKDYEENNVLKTASDQKRADEARKIFEQLGKDELAADQAISRDLSVSTQQELKEIVEANAQIIRSDQATKAQRIAAQDAITDAVIKASAVLTNEAQRVRDNEIDRLNIEQAERRKHIEQTIKDEAQKLAAIEALENLYRRKRAITEQEFQDELKRISGSVGTVPVIAEGQNPYEKALGQLTDAGPNGTVMKTMEQFAAGLGNIAQQFILLSTTGPAAMRKVTASVLAAVSAQALTQAVMFTAYGIAALTPWGAAIYGPAAPWFKAAALMAAVAVGTGVAGRAVAGDSFSGAGSGSGANNTQGDGSPQRENLSSGGPVNYGGGNRGSIPTWMGELRAAFDRNTMAVAQNEETNNKLLNRISSVAPGVLVARGLDENPGAAFEAVDKTLEDGGSFAAGKMMRNLGFAT